MISGLVARHTISVRRAPLVDDGRGNEVRDWAESADHPSAGWAVDAGDTTEDLEHRDGSSVSYTLRGPILADVLGSDRVIIFGDVFEVVGGVLKQPGPTQMTSHCIIKLTRWEG